MRSVAGLVVIAGLFPAMFADAVGAADIVGTVTKTVDGDTFDMRAGTGTVRIRFCGIDAPERGQPGGREATTALMRMIDGKQVRCVPVGQGTPCDGRSKPTNRDRIVAQCFLGDVDIAYEMVVARHACDWAKFSGGHYRPKTRGYEMLTKCEVRR